MMLNIALTLQEAKAVQDAMGHYIDGMTTAYQKDLRSKLGIALSADETIDSAIADHGEPETDDSKVGQPPYRKDLFKWLGTCPDQNWFIADEDEGFVKVNFCIDNEESGDD